MRDTVLVEMLRKNRGFIIVCFAVLLAAVGLWWLYGHGRLVLDSEGTSLQTTYYISNGKSGKNITEKISDKSVTKILGSGQYQVLVQQGDKSYWKVIKVGHFLIGSSVKPGLQAERARTFVGTNPASCMQLINGVLVSYTCGGTADTLKVHMPATDKLPTYTKNIPNGFTNQIEGLVLTAHGPVYISKQLEAIGLSSAHQAIKLNQAVDPTSTNVGSVGLKGLDSSRTYVAVPFKEGFVMYDATFRDVLYFSDPSVQPQIIDLSTSNNKADIPIRFDSNGQMLVAAYSNSVGDTDGSTPNPVTELSLNTGGKTKHFNLPGTFQATLACGNSSICTIDDKGLTVYDASGSKLKRRYDIPGVRIIGRFGSDSILFLKDRNVIALNVEKGTGYIAYSLGNYQLNAISDSGSSALLNLLNSKGTGVALQLTNDTVDPAIDKQVDVLLHSTNISSVSAYGRYIFVSPNFGETEYIPSLHVYDYPADRKQTVNNAIIQDVKAAGIDTTKYVIVNPYAR